MLQWKAGKLNRNETIQGRIRLYEILVYQLISFSNTTNVKSAVGHFWAISIDKLTFFYRAGLVWFKYPYKLLIHLTHPTLPFHCQVQMSFPMQYINPVVSVLYMIGVLFQNMGQSAYLSDRDARYPVAFLDVGDLFSSSYLISNIFENSFSTVVGVHATNGLAIQNTVIYKARGSGEAIFSCIFLY